MSLLNSAANNPTGLGAIKCEKPRVLTIDLDFSVANPVTLDLSQLQQLHQFETLQSMYIAALNLGGDLTFTMLTTRQIITIRDDFAAYMPLIAPAIAPVLTVGLSGAGGIIVPLHLLNFYVAPHVWQIA